MVELHNNRVPTSFEVVLLVFEYFYNNQQFTIMSFIASFSVYHFL